MMIASADESEDPLEALIQLGMRQGYLSYEMLNDRLPDEVILPERLDGFLCDLDRYGIRLIDADQSRQPGD